MWGERCLGVALSAVLLSVACSGEDAGGAVGTGGAAGMAGPAGAGGADTSSCPGAALSCPAECPTIHLEALTPEGCLEPQVASCTLPTGPRTLDAGCVKREQDDQLFYVPQGGMQTVPGFLECTSKEYGSVITADVCSDGGDGDAPGDGPSDAIGDADKD